MRVVTGCAHRQTEAILPTVTAVAAPNDPLLLLSATQLARMIRAREVSSRDVVEAHIRRVVEVNPVVNAVVRDRFADARAEADAADARVRDTAPEELPPFHGVPCTIKECFALTGMPQSSGLVARKNFIAATDATAVARIRRAGAIPLGVTNTSELCMWMESSNKVYGRTNNPYDPSRTVGGSSGGEGAVVGAGASPFGLGSDIGGSIRMPAFFNGVFGHKPSGGLVPGSGQHPVAHGVARKYLTTGPLTRRAEDLFPLLRRLAGPDGEDPACETMPLVDPATVALEGLTVHVVPGDGVRTVAPSLLAAQQRAASALAARGARIVKTDLPELAQAFDIWGASMHAAGGASFASLLGDGKNFRPALELLRLATGRSPHTVPSVGLALLERIPAFRPAATRRAVKLGEELRAGIATLLGERAVILYPPYPCPAPRHHAPMLPPHGFPFAAIWNILHSAVTQVPLGLDDAGLPLGVQVIARPGGDHLTIAVALELERALGGWVPPGART